MSFGTIVVLFSFHKKALYCFLVGRGKKMRNISVIQSNDRSLVSVLHALVLPALTPQGANEISMFIQMSFPSPLAHSDTTCVNMWLHTSATMASPEIAVAQIELPFAYKVPRECKCWIINIHFFSFPCSLILSEPQAIIRVLPNYKSTYRELFT